MNTYGANITQHGLHNKNCVQLPTTGISPDHQSSKLVTRNLLIILFVSDWLTVMALLKIKLLPYWALIGSIYTVGQLYVE